MLTVEKKSGRKIRAMVMKEPVDQCLGVIQCALRGCEGHMAIVAPGTRRASGRVEDGSPKDQIEWFLDHHECRAPSQRGRRT